VRFKGRSPDEVLWFLNEKAERLFAECRWILDAGWKEVRPACYVANRWQLRAYPLPPLERIRANMLARNRSALYQQRPTPDEGEMFAPDRTGLKTNTDDVIVWVRAWDLAGSKEGDWTVGVMMGLTRDRKVVVGNVRRLRGRPRGGCGRHRRDGQGRHPAGEDRHGHRSRSGGPRAERFLHEAAQRLRGRLVTGERQEGRSRRAVRVQVNNSNVSMTVGDWNAAYRNELRSFPYGKYDDQVDASSRAHMVLTAAKLPMRINPAVLERA
jgi:phage terminase large subunit-like protein